MSTPTVTTIIPAYNAAGTIARAIESLLGQTRPPDEILVVDDGSPDDLTAAMRPYENVVTLVRKPNGGAASARNLGIDLARGELIAFLDADDYWEPNKLERQLEIFRTYPEVAVTAAGYYTQPPGQPRFLKHQMNQALCNRVLRASGDEVFEIMVEFWTTTVVVRREALEGLRFLVGLQTAEDRDMWIRLIAAWPVYLESQPLATYVLEPGSLSRTHVDRDCENFQHVIQTHRSLLSQRGLRYWESQLYKRWASGLLSDGRPEAARRPAALRLRLEPTSLEAWWVYLKSVATSRRASASASDGNTAQSKLLA